MADVGLGVAGSKRDRFAFFVTLVLIVGFLLLLAVPTLRWSTADAKDPAAIFSGWIVAVLGFCVFKEQA